MGPKAYFIIDYDNIAYIFRGFSHGMTQSIIEFYKTISAGSNVQSYTNCGVKIFKGDVRNENFKNFVI